MFESFSMFPGSTQVLQFENSLDLFSHPLGIFFLRLFWLLELP